MNSTTRLEWVTEDPASQHVLEIAGKVADTSTTVLITGESGTGKDQLARWIHEAGPRRDAPYLKIDCASLPSELVESELFGHERGAFTGAEARKPGRMELAEDGTIVLDEVVALAPAVQSKLLRVLEERKFERLGGTETLEMNARLVALTNADLERAVRGGYFREDLYFRLNVLVIKVPP
ncbi:MAG: sigma-54 factor interaction domain-containing protein, partial [Candidatus Acidiferrales bacterium]